MRATYLCIPKARVWAWTFLAFTCSSALLSIRLGAAENAPPTPASAKAQETNSDDVLRSYLQLQEQIHATRLAIEHSREEADAAAARSSAELANRLQSIEQSLVMQRAREMEAMQSSNRRVVAVAGAFGAIGLLTMMFMAYSHWRAMHRLAEIASGLVAAPAGPPSRSVAALSAGESHIVTIPAADQSNQRLIGAVERLEKRIIELEHVTTPHLAELAEPAAPQASPEPTMVTGSSPPQAENGVSTPPDIGKLDELLGKGQSLLSLDKPEEALSCFNEALGIDPHNPEALVKKGTALERLRKLDEAIECYDQAIAGDASMTIAYLYKGGIFNRMERFSEALECYEKALRTQEKRVA